ncbi:choice-of-anchor J domain-containing protein [Winogradskyella sp. F6397]|uniref:Choice-of-anchor J domain-containing protein n=1 Tax=Winogradskyella marina TaxID=2785530 RepID=A0ABS0EFL5_9FLAO|nr:MULTISPECIES: DUF5689 domain-containing protein [Winogradskyella]MBF8149245.1 choice-of-anchor J domain-containing protein [Winogradskyella marina]
MNKAIKSLKLIVVLVASIAMTSCVQDDDYTIPNSLGDEENEALEELLATGSEVSFETVKAMYTEGEFIEPEDTNVYVKGYVTSSDRTGNFFKEFFIQDSPTNPTSGLKVILNQVDTYNQFNLGREVYISLQDLYIGEERVGNGVTTIGGGTETDQFGTTVTSLNEIQIRQKVLRSSVTEDITPLNIGLTAINGDHVGLLVKVDNVEFADDEVGLGDDPNVLNYFDPTETFDTKRTLQDCGGFTYPEFILETSSFSSFKNEKLPTGNGSITAVVSKTFDGASLVLALNTTDDVDMENPRCTLLDIEDFEVVFNEGFDSGLGDWEVINTLGTQDWYASSYQGEGYVRGSAFDDDNIVEMISWLISPSIDFDANENERLILQVADAFSNGQPLKAYYSNDYVSGTNPDDATWTEIGASEISALPENTGFFNNVYDATGLINISMIEGDAVLAFVYDSDDATVSTTIDLSNVQILAQ